MENHEDAPRKNKKKGGGCKKQPSKRIRCGEETDDEKDNNDAFGSDFGGAFSDDGGKDAVKAGNGGTGSGSGSVLSTLKRSSKDFRVLVNGSSRVFCSDDSLAAIAECGFAVHPDSAADFCSNGGGPTRGEEEGPRVLLEGWQPKKLSGVVVKGAAAKDASFVDGVAGSLNACAVRLQVTTPTTAAARRASASSSNTNTKTKTPAQNCALPAATVVEVPALTARMLPCHGIVENKQMTTKKKRVQSDDDDEREDEDEDEDDGCDSDHRSGKKGNLGGGKRERGKNGKTVAAKTAAAGPFLSATAAALASPACPFPLLTTAAHASKTAASSATAAMAASQQQPRASSSSSSSSSPAPPVCVVDAALNAAMPVACLDLVPSSPLASPSSPSSMCSGGWWLAVGGGLVGSVADLPPTASSSSPSSSAPSSLPPMPSPPLGAPLSPNSSSLNLVQLWFIPGTPSSPSTSTATWCDSDENGGGSGGGDAVDEEGLLLLGGGKGKQAPPSQLPAPHLEYCLAHQGGTVCDVKWAPPFSSSSSSSSSKNNPGKTKDDFQAEAGRSQRMGVLAVASADGLVRVYAPPSQNPAANAVAATATAANSVSHNTATKSGSATDSTASSGRGGGGCNASAQGAAKLRAVWLAPLAVAAPPLGACFVSLCWRPVANAAPGSGGQPGLGACWPRYACNLAAGASDGTLLVWDLDQEPEPAPPAEQPAALPPPPPYFTSFVHIGPNTAEALPSLSTSPSFPPSLPPPRPRESALKVVRRLLSPKSVRHSPALSAVKALAFSPSSAYCAGAVPNVRSGDENQEEGGVSILPVQGILASVDVGGLVRVWDLSRPWAPLVEATSTAIGAVYSMWVSSLGWLSDASCLVLGGGYPNTAFLQRWTASGGRFNLLTHAHPFEAVAATHVVRDTRHQRDLVLSCSSEGSVLLSGVEAAAVRHLHYGRARDHKTPASKIKPAARLHRLHPVAAADGDDDHGDDGDGDNDGMGDGQQEQQQRRRRQTTLVRTFEVNCSTEWVDTLAEVSKAAKAKHLFGGENALASATGAAAAATAAAEAAAAAAAAATSETSPPLLDTILAAAGKGASKQPSAAAVTPPALADLAGGLLSATCFHFLEPPTGVAHGVAPQGPTAPVSFLVVSGSPSGVVRCQSVGHGALLADLRP